MGKPRISKRRTTSLRKSPISVGMGIGALVGILFAPKSGEETREYLAHKAGEGKEYTRSKARDLRERVEGIVERGKRAAVR